HALKNALIPVVTIIGGQLGVLLAGTFVVEQIFALPGMGRLTVEAILYRDYPVVQTNVMLVAATLVTLNLHVDLTYAWLDPPIRCQSGRDGNGLGAGRPIRRPRRSQHRAAPVAVADALEEAARSFLRGAAHRHPVDGDLRRRAGSV